MAAKAIAVAAQAGDSDRIAMASGLLVAKEVAAEEEAASPIPAPVDPTEAKASLPGTAPVAIPVAIPATEEDKTTRATAADSTPLEMT